MLFSGVYSLNARPFLRAPFSRPNFPARESSPKRPAAAQAMVSSYIHNVYIV
jgi:hypothetical protein